MLERVTFFVILYTGVILMATGFGRTLSTHIEAIDLPCKEVTKRFTEGIIANTIASILIIIDPLLVPGAFNYVNPIGYYIVIGMSLVFLAFSMGSIISRE